jgi:hypothetical protein
MDCCPGKDRWTSHILYRIVIKRRSGWRFGMHDDPMGGPVMSIRMKCRSCGQAVALKGRPAGASVRCPKCREVISVPESDNDDDVDAGGDYTVGVPPTRSAEQISDDVPRLAKSDLPQRRRERSGNGRVPGWLIVLGGALVVGIMLAAFWPNESKDTAIPYRDVAEQTNFSPAAAPALGIIEGASAVPADGTDPGRGTKPSPGANSPAAAPQAIADSAAPAKSNASGPPAGSPAPGMGGPPPAAGNPAPGMGGPPAAASQPTAQAASPAAPSRGTPTDTYGGTGGLPFAAVSPDGPLLGLRYSIGSWTGEMVIGQIEPVFDRATPKSRLKSIVARKGFAVGALEVDSDKLVNALRIVFMHIDQEGKLDPTKS